MTVHQSDIELVCDIASGIFVPDKQLAVGACCYNNSHSTISRVTVALVRLATNRHALKNAAPGPLTPDS